MSESREELNADIDRRRRDVRRRIALVTGVAMVGIGLAIMVHFAVGRAPLAGNSAIDGAFALFFLVRGWLNLRTAQRLKA
ncbi:MAG: hypothetical protein JWO05_734 [Gemmatimonadetes bacterium]|nr:hypothetical protein [Gemmatimonadota bacterium]